VKTEEGNRIDQTTVVNTVDEIYSYMTEMVFWMSSGFTAYPNIDIGGDPNRSIKQMTCHSKS